MITDKIKLSIGTGTQVVLVVGLNVRSKSLFDPKGFKIVTQSKKEKIDAAVYSPKILDAEGFRSSGCS